MESVDQIESVIAAQALGVEELREDQRQQHQQSNRDLPLGQLRWHIFTARLGDAGLAMRLIPVRHAIKNRHRDQSCARKPGKTGLTVRENNECRHQWTGSRADVASDLKDRLREAVATA